MAYTLEQIRLARKNALAAGETEAAEKLGRFAVQLAMQQAPQEEHDPTEGMSTFSKVRSGIGQGMTNVARHLGSIAGVVSDEKLADAKALDAPLLDTTAGKVGSLIGETAATALPVAGTIGVAARGGAAAARALSNPLTRGAIEGAVHGGVMADPGERGSGALLGAGLGGIVPGAAAVGSKAVRGLTRTPEAQALLDRGVELTPGQMNPRGVINQMEESWQSIPLAGPVIKGARENAQRGYQRSIVKEGAAPGAQIPEGEIDQMLDAAYRSFEPLYDQAKGFPVRPVVMRTSGGDVPLVKLFRSAATSQGTRATDATRDSVGKWLRNQITQFDGSSDGLLAMRSAIRAESRKARVGGAKSADDLAAAELLDNAEDAVTQALESQLPKEALTALRTADGKYGTYKTIEDAVAAAKDQPGGFSPAQLSTAVKAATQKGAYARGGGGDLRELASAGREVFDVRSPPTGQRLAAIGIPAAIGVSNPAVGIPAAATALGMVGTRTGRRLAAGQTSPQRMAQALLEGGQRQLTDAQRQALAQLLRRASVSGGTALVAQE